MITKQRFAVVPPENRKDIDDYVLRQMGGESEADADALAEGLSNLTRLRALIYQQDQQLQDVQSRLDEIQKTYGQDLLEKEEQLAKERSSTNRELLAQLQKMQAAFKATSSNYYEAIVTIDGASHKIQLLLENVKVQGHKVAYTAAFERFKEALREFMGASADELYDKIIRDCTPPDEFEDQLKMYFDTKKAYRYAGFFSRIWDWLKSRWQEVLSWLAASESTSNEVANKTTELDAALDALEAEDA